MTGTAEQKAAASGFTPQDVKECTAARAVRDELSGGRLHEAGKKEHRA